MKKTILTAFLLATIITVQAQSRSDEGFAPPAKVVFAELGGPGIASINYDMRFKGEGGLGFRAGLGGFNVDGGSLILVPVGLNYIASRDQRNYIEIGGGITPVIAKSEGDDPLTATFGHLNIGYRLQPANGGFFFRAAINPLIGSGFFWPFYGGVGFGYKF
ncbi:hypothetical protein [Aridibaculum aurantiacum]|uniref:hypothetical protein n=1 Tax=Aridibaculum aurantiacum TaxID=2810307 RepID=UPI001A96B002|nr:hypothetical protein [Aridibaculum aurantiacum]